MKVGLCVITLLDLTRLAFAGAVPTETAAILVGQMQCGFAPHDYRKWVATSVGENWEVRGNEPRRFTAMGQGVVTVPKSGATPFDCYFLSPPGVTADSFNAFMPQQSAPAAPPQVNTLQQTGAAVH